MRKFGLIGYPLGHSFSKSFFTKKFDEEHISDAQYENYPIENIDLLPELLSENKNLSGLNVTIPYKQKVLTFLDEIDEEALQIGAVNCLKIISSEKNKIKIKGYNTDCYGFRIPLEKILKPWHTKALILGTGGASKAVEYVLKSLKIEYRYVSRNPNKSTIMSYSQITEKIIEEYTLIINTTPLGMYPNLELFPDIPYKLISERHIMYDLIYNPEQSRFLEFGKQKKATLLNGLPMLHLQAEKSWEIWNA